MGITNLPGRTPFKDYRTFDGPLRVVNHKSDPANDPRDYGSQYLRRPIARSGELLRPAVKDRRATRETPRRTGRRRSSGPMLGHVPGIGRVREVDR